MEVAGIAVDADELRSTAAELSAQCKSLEAEIHSLAGGEPFNVNSTPAAAGGVVRPAQALARAGAPRPVSPRMRQPSRSCAGRHPIIDTILRYREVEKLRSTYGESLLAEVGADGRIHASFNQTVARTGRLSSDRPNLHNIPVRTEEGRRLRRAFVPSPGHVLLVADYDQIELRVIAHLSGDPGLVLAFEEHRDIHRATAAKVFGVAPEDVTFTQRSRAKMVSYGLAYGMESYGLAQRLGIETAEAAEILGSYFAAFPLVRELMDRSVADARARGYTVTLLGRRRPLPDLHSPNRGLRMAAERQAMNAGIQGLAADLFKVALVRLDGALEEGGFSSRLVLQVHDEVIARSPNRRTIRGAFGCRSDTCGPRRGGRRGRPVGTARGIESRGVRRGRKRRITCPEPDRWPNRWHSATYRLALAPGCPQVDRNPRPKPVGTNLAGRVVSRKRAPTTYVRPRRRLRRCSREPKHTRLLRRSRPASGYADGHIRR